MTIRGKSNMAIRMKQILASPVMIRRVALELLLTQLQVNFLLMFRIQIRENGILIAKQRSR